MILTLEDSKTVQETCQVCVWQEMTRERGSSLPWPGRLAANRGRGIAAVPFRELAESEVLASGGVMAIGWAGTRVRR